MFLDGSVDQASRLDLFLSWQCHRDVTWRVECRAIEWIRERCTRVYLTRKRARSAVSRKPVQLSRSPLWIAVWSPVARGLSAPTWSKACWRAACTFAFLTTSAQDTPPIYSPTRKWSLCREA